MDITQALKSTLLTEFKSEKQLLHSIKNYELYKFSNYNINQTLSIFNKTNSKLFSETNSKKHSNKVIEMVKSEFLSSKTNNYFTLFFNPINDEKEILFRLGILEKLNFDINKKELKNLYSDIIDFRTKINFSNNIITLDKKTEEILFDKYKLNIQYISKLELEHEFESLDKETLIICEDDLYVDFPVYTLKEFEKIIIGNLINSNKNLILIILNILENFEDLDKIKAAVNSLTKLNFNSDLDLQKLKEEISKDIKNDSQHLSEKISDLDMEVEKINQELKQIISTKNLSLQGEELLELLNSGDLEAVKKKLNNDTQKIILDKEKELLTFFRKNGLKIDCLFSRASYPLELDEEVKETLFNQIEQNTLTKLLSHYETLGNFSIKEIKSLINLVYFFDLFQGIKSFQKKYDLQIPQFDNSFELKDGKNIYIENPIPIDYGIGSNNFNLKGEKVSILTGANSGGKTTLLEMFLQSQILTCTGLGINASKESKIKIFDEIIYLRKFTGTQGSGAFEQTIRNLIEILNSDSSKLILVDEFEAVTEPGAAAKILIKFLTEITKKNCLCIAVSHLGIEIQSYLEKNKITNIRIDGISATGLDEKGNLITNHQPQFYELGKSTPELILKRILHDTKFWKNKSDDSKEILNEMIN